MLPELNVVGGDPGVGRLGDRQTVGTAHVGAQRAHVIERCAARVGFAHERDDRPRERRDKQPSGLRIEGATRPGAAARIARQLDGAALAGRREQRPVLEVAQDLFGLLPDLGREVDEIRKSHTLALVGRRFGRERLSGRGALAGNAGLRDLTIFDGPHRLPARPVEDVEEPLLAQLHGCLDRASVDFEVAQDRRGHEVVVPQPVPHCLEVPASLASLAVDRHHALGKQVVAGPVTAVPVVRGSPEGQIGEAQLFVDAHQGPDVGVAGVLPRALFPGLVTDFARLRHRVERPQLLAGAHVEAADVTRRRLGAVGAVRDRRADDGDVATDHDG